MQGKPALTEDDFAEVSNALKARRKPVPAPVSWAFVIVMIALALFLASLGIWQLDRLGQKEALIAAVDARIDLPPAALPPVAEWDSFDEEVFNFRPVKLEGRFVPDNSVLVFTSMTGTRGPYEGQGFWVMSPFALETGGTVLVNRGFVPQGAGQRFIGASGDATLPQGTVTITGLARVSEATNTFTPGPDLAGHIEYVRNIDRLIAMMDAELAPVAPIYVDQDAAKAGDLPQGGETVIDFPNRHFEYAMTWFLLSAVTVLMTGMWLWRQRAR